MNAKQSIVLNFNNAAPVKTGLIFKAGDKGITFDMDVRELDPTGMTPKIVFYRSNATSVESDDITETDGIFSYTTLGNEFAVPGVVVADLKFYDGDDQRVSTASFIFMVASDTLDGIGGGTAGYSDQLEQLSQEFSDTLEEYKDAFGDVGAINPRGAYDSTADYNVLDLVSYQGSSYLCRTACKNKVPTNTTYWQVFASGGGGGGTGDYDDLDNKPSINSVTLSGNKTTEDLGLFSGDYDDLTNKPELFSGDYDDLTNKPTLFSGDYDDLTNKPSIPSNFDDLADVDMTGVTNGQVPAYNSSTGKYEPVTPSSGGGGGTNPNLLINGWFTVNQRSFTSGSSAGYTVDRWKKATSAGTLTLTSNGLQFPASTECEVQQIFESMPWDGREITISLMYSDGTIVSGTDTWTTGGAKTFISDGKMIVGLNSSGNLSVKHSTSDANTRTIRAVKLEIGSTSTLHLDAAPDYTTELQKCWRYYRRVTAYSNNSYFAMGAAISTSTALMYFPLNVPLRTVPTPNVTNISLVANAATIINAKINSASSVMRNDALYGLSVSTLSGTGLTQGAFVTVMLNSASDYFELDAEL